jgi:hypothetical protein
MSVSCECCVLSGRGLCVGLITRPEESYRVWCVWVWSWSVDNEYALAHWGLLRHGEEGVGEIRICVLRNVGTQEGNDSVSNCVLRHQVLSAAVHTYTASAMPWCVYLSTRLSTERAACYEMLADAKWSYCSWAQTLPDRCLCMQLLFSAFSSVFSGSMIGVFWKHQNEVWSC